MIKITESARNRIILVMNEENASIIRFGLQGGGCHGFTYYFAIEEAKDPDDLEFPLDNMHTLVIDMMSNMYLEEAEIDYKKDLMGENFVFNNPGASTACGCGHSVSF
jgi:iron-sulfur cluster assembly accessory protein